MSKDKIKELLRESFHKFSLSEENSKEDDKDENGENEEGGKERKNYKKDYEDVLRAFDRETNPTAPTQVGVMKAMGVEDDEDGVNRSLFGKKLRQVKNDSGGIYQYNEDELAQIRAILKLS